MAQPGPGRAHRKGITLVELLKLFPDDEAAELFFIKKRWPDGIACHWCGSTRVQVGCKHKTMPFRCRDCRKRFSVRTGTVMQSSKLGLQVWMIAAYLLTTSLKGVSSMKLHRDLGITQKSAWFLAHRLRETWRRDGLESFFGPVEADETFLGGKRKNMHAKQREKLDGRGSQNKVTVVAIRDRKTKQVKAKVVDRVDSGAAVFAMQNADPAAPIYTDEAPVYDCIPNHESVKHSIGEYVRGEVSTNGMESWFSMLKRGYIGTFHRMSPEHTHRYVQEFEGRHNARDLDTAEQLAAMVRGAEGRRLRYADLIDHGGERAWAE